MSKSDDLKQLQEDAWLGDAVLEVYARQRVLRERGGIDEEMRKNLTRNSFLNCIANPTVAEANIGRRFRAGGLDAAWAWIAEHLEPVFAKQEANRQRGVARRK